MLPTHQIVLVFALVLAVVGAWQRSVESPPRPYVPHAGWLAVACLALAQLVP